MPEAYFTSSSASFNTVHDFATKGALFHNFPVPQARLASNGNRPVKIIQAKAKLASFSNVTRTVTLTLGSTTSGAGNQTGAARGSCNFSTTFASSGNQTPVLPYQNIDARLTTTPFSMNLRLSSNAAIWVGNDSVSGGVDIGNSTGRKVWGQYKYVQVPVAPSTPSISASRENGTVTASWSAISDWGDSSSDLGYMVEILQNGSLHTSGTTSSTSLTFTVPSGNNYSARVYAYNEIRSFNNSPMSEVSGTSSSVTLQSPIVNYTVSFNSNGGSLNPSSQTVQSGNTIILPSPGTRTNFQFNGWVSSYNGQFYQINQASHAIFANTTFTASWTQLTWTVSFNGNGGTTPSSQTVNRGSAVILPNSTRSGFTLLGWYTSSVGGSSVGNAGQSYIPSSNITLFAQWQELAPGFTDEIVSQRVPININFNTVADNRVIATNATSYSLISAGGTFPTWLSINNSGFLSGSTDAVGLYTFRVRATSSTGQTADSNIITITVFHPGKRYNAATASNVEFTNGAFRRDSSGAFVPLTTMKRYNGTSWVDISN